MITRNYKNILKDILQNTGRYPVEDGAYGAYLLKTPTNESVYTTQQPPQLPEYLTRVAKDNTSGGVVIGSGSTPAQESDYWLSNQITSGFDGYVSDVHQTDNDGNHGIVLSVIIMNTGSSNLTIGEIGYSLHVLSSVHEGGDSSYTSMLRNVLIDRTVLGSPITIGAGQAAIIDYALKTVDLFGGSTALGTKTITQNGTYNAGSDDLDGYSIVEVNVSGGGATVEPLSVAQNGTYTAPSGKAYNPVSVSVTPNLQSKTATQNGTVVPDQGYDGLSSVVVNVSGGGGSGVVLSGTSAPTAEIGSDEDLYVQYSVHTGWNHLYSIDALYRKVSGAWVNYVDPTDPNAAVHVWTQSTSGSNAAMYVQKANYDPNTGTYTPVGDAVIVVYTSVRGTVTYDLFGLATLGYPQSWVIKATGNITDGTQTYADGDTVATWGYNATTDIYLRWA